MDQKSNIEILLSNVDVTLSGSNPNHANDRPMTPEETIYFRNEKKTLERELARLDGVSTELREQKMRCDLKLDRVKQKMEEAEAKHRGISPPPPPPSYLEAPTHSSDPPPPSPPHQQYQYQQQHSKPSTSSPTRTISPYFYYGNNKDRIELPPPPDKYTSLTLTPLSRSFSSLLSLSLSLSR
jgi:hypothetical protein